MTLAYLAAAWVLGTVAAALGWDLAWAVAGGAAVLAAGTALLRHNVAPALLVLLCAGLFAAGMLRFQADETPTQPTGIAVFNDTDAPVNFRALVTDDPDEKTRSLSIRLAATDVLQDGEWQPISGGVLLQQGLFPRYKYGDLI